MDEQKTLFLIVGVLVLGLVIGGAFSGQAVRKIKIIGGGGSGCTDRDGDGYYKNTGCGTLVDCNDDNPSIHPNAIEICQDGIDQNCNYIDEACTTTTIAPSGCYDSDGGQNIYIKGYVTYINQNFYDECVYTNSSSHVVSEYFCNNNGLAQVIQITCPNGYICGDAACRIPYSSTIPG